jgi:hypothetical protein
MVSPSATGAIAISPRRPGPHASQRSRDSAQGEEAVTRREVVRALRTPGQLDRRPGLPQLSDRDRDPPTALRGCAPITRKGRSSGDSKYRGTRKARPNDNGLPRAHFLLPSGGRDDCYARLSARSISYMTSMV